MTEKWVKMMSDCIIEVKRIAYRNTYTIGKMYIDGKYVCDTIEDKVRPAGEKVYGETAIPAGKYRVTMNVVSPKFQYRAQYAFCGGKLPRLLNVPNYEGVLIHIGNTSKDTLGCILVGYNKVVGKVVNSTVAFHEVYSLLKAANDKGRKIYCNIH